MYLYHYYDKSIGPFVNLSDLQSKKQSYTQQNQETKPDTYCAKRPPEYMENRHYYEEILRTEFVKRRYHIEKISHYMVVEHSLWLSTWYENCAYIRIPIEEFDLRTVSFTHGDSHPVFSPRPNMTERIPQSCILMMKY